MDWLFEIMTKPQLEITGWDQLRVAALAIVVIVAGFPVFVVYDNWRNGKG